jgi:hypothetical protein
LAVALNVTLLRSILRRSCLQARGDFAAAFALGLVQTHDLITQILHRCEDFRFVI